MARVKITKVSKASPEAQAMAKQLQSIKYCPFCGKPVLLTSTDENGYDNKHLEWEMQYDTHWSCYVKNMKGVR